jgi:hypothetical protein
MGMGAIQFHSDHTNATNEVHVVWSSHHGIENADLT